MQVVASELQHGRQTKARPLLLNWCAHPGLLPMQHTQFFRFPHCIMHHPPKGKVADAHDHDVGHAQMPTPHGSSSGPSMLKQHFVPTHLPGTNQVPASMESICVGG